jgi:hypothetical protein
MHALVAKTGTFSALLPRIIVDGAWFRVLFGSGSLLLWIFSIALTAWDATTNPLTFGRPSDVILFILILISFIDALAGVFAFITVIVFSVIQGEILIAADVRMLLGLGVLMSTLPLLVHVIRPLRRIWRGNAFAKVERLFDYVMPPVFVAFAAGSMLKALNGLSGLELVTTEQIEFIRYAGFFGVLIRMVGEDVAGSLFPARTLLVNPAKLASPGRTVSFASIVFKSLIFIFIAIPFFGLSIITISAALVLALPQVLKLWEDNLPNWQAIHKWLPRGLLRFSLLLVLGIFLSRWLLGSEPSDDVIRNTFVWLLLPASVVGVIELVGRSGGDWNNIWIKWASGAAVWSFTIGLTLGLIKI